MALPRKHRPIVRRGTTVSFLPALESLAAAKPTYPLWTEFQFEKVKRVVVNHDRDGAAVTVPKAEFEEKGKDWPGWRNTSTVGGGDLTQDAAGVWGYRLGG